jgi:hypothetical protein
MAKQVSKPKVSSTPTEHQFMNHVFKFPSKLKWDDIEVTFIDSFQANMGSRFYNILRGAGYQQPGTFEQALTGMTKAQAVQAVGVVTLRQLDGGSVDSTTPSTMGFDPEPTFNAGNIREEWELKNAQITKITWGEGMNYTEDGLVEVTVGLAYDYATYTELNIPYGL